MRSLYSALILVSVGRRSCGGGDVLDGGRPLEGAGSVDEARGEPRPSSRHSVVVDGAMLVLNGLVSVRDGEIEWMCR